MSAVNNSVAQLLFRADSSCSLEVIASNQAISKGKSQPSLEGNTIGSKEVTETMHEERL
jgi:hypothetical protein